MPISKVCHDTISIHINSQPFIISTFYCFALPDVKQKPYIYKLNLIACNSFQNKCICNHFTITINNMIIKYVLQCPLGGFSSKKNKPNLRACNSFQNKCIGNHSTITINNIIIKYVLQCPLGGFSLKKTNWSTCSADKTLRSERTMSPAVLKTCSEGRFWQGGET